MNDTQDKIGLLLQGEEERDAIHVAVLPVTADHQLRPGQHVGIKGYPGNYRAEGIKPLRGIVDPFLKGEIQEGQRFWVFLYPNTVQSIRHHWTLAGIDGGAKVEAYARLRDTLIEVHGGSVEELLDEVQGGDGAEVYFGSESGPELKYDEGFWQDVELLLDKKISKEDRDNLHFRCAC